VKIIPAAKDSPALAIVWTALFSNILTFLKKERRIIIDITAAGILAETVIPAYNPKYAFAAVISIPSRIPTTTTLPVSSSGDSEAGIYGSPCSDMVLGTLTSC
jgi:hypothetical protein